MTPDRNFGFRTRALHAGTPPNAASGATSSPVEISTGFVFDSIAHAKELFSLRAYGNIYTRISNPTVAAFEEKIANLEGGLGAVATSSGQAAQMVAIFSLAQNGDHLVASSNIYGGTVTQLNVSLRRLGIETTFVSDGSPEAMATAVRKNTKAMFVETIGNPSGTSLTSEALADAAHAAGLPLIVDNTFATPYLCRPIEHGADIVLHSATKYICGHGTVIAGVVVESGKFNWGGGKHPLLSEPSPSYHHVRFTETFNEYAFLTRARAEVMRDLGACLSPMNGWLLIQGFGDAATAHGGAHLKNAVHVAAFWRRHAGVKWVSYPGLPSSPAVPACATVSAAWGGWDRHVPRGRWARRRRAIHRCTRIMESRRQHGRRQKPGPSSRFHDSLAAQREGTGRSRHHPRHDPALGRIGRRRRPHLGSAARVGRGDPSSQLVRHDSY